MRKMIHLFLNTLLFSFYLATSSVLADNSIEVPILAYHNFDPSVPGSMTVSTRKFEEQLKWLKDNGYTVIPLQDLVSYLQGKTSSLPEKSVVITADDGKKSVYTYMLPLAKKYNIPVTLFIYPSAISNASYAMTWQQLKELKDTGLFDIQGHTYWHPNFKTEKKKLSEADYQKLVDTQLVKSKKVLEDKLNINVTLLAWPFGIYDDYLEKQAQQAGYVAAFSIDDRLASRSENMMSQPRYLMVEGHSMQTFASIVKGEMKGHKK